jgi:hypothetical protein
MLILYRLIKKKEKMGELLRGAIGLTVSFAVVLYVLLWFVVAVSQFYKLAIFGS